MTWEAWKKASAPTSWCWIARCEFAGYLSEEWRSCARLSGIMPNMEITWLGHGTFQFRLPAGQVILMDPWTDGNPAYPAGHKIDRCDMICITHGHFDHIHDAVPLARQFSPEVVAIYETAVWLESKGVKNTRGMNKGGSQQVGDVTVTMV